MVYSWWAIRGALLLLVATPATGKGAGTSGPNHVWESVLFQRGQRLQQDVPEREFGRTDQSTAERMVSSRFTDVPLARAIIELAKQANVRVASNASIIPSDVRVTQTFDRISLRDAYGRLLKGTGLMAVFQSDGTVVIRAIERGSDSVVASGRVVGIVLDSATRRPVAGASVLLQKVSRTVVTEPDGRFVIEHVPAGQYELSVRGMGYATRIRTVVVRDTGATRLEIELRMIASQLSDVVTTASGLQRRAEVPSDIVKIDPQKMMERAPVRSVADLITAAQVPGVIVERQSGDPGAPVRFRMRGLRSIAQTNDPVILLDGLPIDGARVEDIDPALIETVEIVRGSSAASLYGQDAANGVIIITTKKGRIGPTRWDVTASRDWKSTYGAYPVVYAGVGRTLLSTQNTRCSNDQILAGICAQDSVLAFDPNHPLNRTQGSGGINRTVIRAEGGSNTMNYTLSFNAMDNLGTRQNSTISEIRYRRLGFTPEQTFLQPTFANQRTIALSYSVAPNRKTTITLRTNGTLKTNRNNAYTNSFGSMGLAFDTMSLDTTSLELGVSRIQAVGDRKNDANVAVMSNIDYRISDTWNTIFTAGMDRNNQSVRKLNRLTLCRFGVTCTDSMSDRSDENTDRRIMTLRSRINGSLPPLLGGMLRLRPALGLDFVRTDLAFIRLRQTGIPAGLGGVKEGTGTVSGTTWTKANATAGWFLNTTVILADRLTFDLGIRQDIGSAIVSSKGTNYPKLGTSWLVSDEPFWGRNNIISLFRVRTAVGYSAVQPDVGDIAGRYTSGYTFVNGMYVPTVNVNAVGNWNLQPERAMEVETGVDLGLFNDRVDVVATFARGDSRNVLISRSTAPSVIEGVRKENIAQVRNQNLEVSVKSRVIDRHALALSIDYALTLSDNNVGRVGNRVSPLNYLEGIRAGYPLGGLWSRMLLGYDDIDRNGIVSDDEVILSDSAVYIGWSLPKYVAKYGVNVRIHQLLSLDTRFSYQSQYVKRYTGYTGSGLEDQHAPLDVQALARAQSLNGQRPVTDLRWQSASVNVHMPKRVIQRLHARSLSVSLQASNLYTWTNYLGHDPSVSSIFNMVAIDAGGVTPVPRNFTLEFRLGL